jgi:cellulose synthase/poly-beta-1,6-N-acetylglucosamine synthase-like glycosyltransferase
MQEDDRRPLAEPLHLELDRSWIPRHARTNPTITPMKLVIQIPCLNEEESLPRMLSELPREVVGFDEVEWLVIDDGSTDRTVEVAREHGVGHPSAG